MPVRVLLLIVLLSLVGCAAALSELGRVNSGLVKTYSPDFRAQAATELEALPDGSALAVLIADYAVLRAQLRAADGLGD